MLRQKPDAPQVPGLPLQISLQRRGNCLCKSYSYPYARDSEGVRERMLAWAEFSRSSRVVPNLTLCAIALTSEGLTVDVEQEFCRRLPHRTGGVVLAHLEELEQELSQAWSLGLVHGDLNRKNIWLTDSGYRVVDIEPLVTVPLAHGGTYLRTTPPYLARTDRDQQTVTAASDRLGFACFSAWVRGQVQRPAQAVAMVTAGT